MHTHVWRRGHAWAYGRECGLLQGWGNQRVHVPAWCTDAAVALHVLRVCVLLLQSDYEAANFDVKKAKGYWELGRLGLEETQELQAKVRRRSCGLAVPCHQL